jgi:lipid-binding SYLF domain-containing protein
MSLRIPVAAAAVVLLGGLLVPRPAVAQADQAKRIRDATAAFHEIMNAPDKAIPREILEKAQGIAVFPGLIKAGFIFGGQRGHGVLSARDPRTGAWSVPAFLTMTGGSWGAQIGGEQIDLVLVVMNRRGLDSLVGNQVKLGAQLSATAGPVGRTAEASTDAALRAEILSYSRSRGLFAGVTVNGAVIQPDTDANDAFYGRPFTTSQIVFQHEARPRPPVDAWDRTLQQYAAVAAPHR